MSLLKRKLAFMAVVNKVKGFVRSVVGIPPLTLPNAVGEDLLDYKIYGESKQNGTPSPEAPVVIESVGDNTINLSPINEIRKQSTSRWSYQNLGKLELVPGKYTVKCHYKQYGTPTKVQISVRDYDELNTAYGYSVYYGLVEDDALVNFTLPTTAKGIQIILYINATADAIDADCEFTNIMLVEGAYTADTIPEYEPFGYKVPIKVIGKNLLSKNSVSNTSFWGTKIIDAKPFLQNLTPGKKYRISADFICDNIPDGNLTQSTFGFQIVKKDASFETIYLADAYNISLNETRHISATFTLPSNTTVDSYYGLYAYMNYYSSGKGCGGRIENIQIEEGTLETTYEPYKDLGTTNIYLAEPLRKMGEYTDYIDFKEGKVVRVINELNLSPKIIPPAINGMYEGGWYHYASYGNYYYIFKPDEYYTYNNDIASKCNSLSFKALSNSSAMTIADDEYYVFYRDTGSSIYRITINEATYNKLLEVDECYFYYPLAEPTEEPIELPTIPTAKGTTTLIADTTTQPSNMDVTYYSSI